MQESPAHTWIPWLALLVILAINWTGVKGALYGFLPGGPSAEDLPAWRADYATALAESQASGKPILVDFTADWCPPCRVMEREVWPDERVRQALNEHTVPLQLDIDDDANSRLADSRRVGSIPTVLLLDSNGKEVARRGILTPSQVLDLVQKHRRVQ